MLKLKDFLSAFSPTRRRSLENFDLNVVIIKIRQSSPSREAPIAPTTTLFSWKVLRSDKTSMMGRFGGSSEWSWM